MIQNLPTSKEARHVVNSLKESVMRSISTITTEDFQDAEPHQMASMRVGKNMRRELLYLPNFQTATMTFIVKSYKNGELYGKETFENLPDAVERFNNS